MNDVDLLRRYVQMGSEEAFGELVRMNLPLVYSAALRQVQGDRHRAEEVAQTVFVALAVKAPKIVSHGALKGWLFTSTRYAAAKLMRSARRRQHRETEVYHMDANEVTQPEVENALGSGVPGVLDDAMHQLGAADREAVMLRFFAGFSLAETGAHFGLSDDAARKRIDRALQRLREALARRGVSCTATALAAGLTHAAVVPVPPTLATTITGAVLAAATTGTTLTGGLTLFAMNKGIIAVTTVLILGTATGIYYRTHWQDSQGDRSSAAQAAQNQRVKAGSEAGVVPAARPARNLTALVRELEGMPQADHRVKLDRALGFFGGQDSAQLGKYLREIDAVDTTLGIKRLFLWDALFQAWGEKAPQEAIAAAEARTGDDVKAVLVGWAANDMLGPWQWLMGHAGYDPIVGTPRGNYLQALIPAMAAQGRLDELQALVSAVPKEPFGAMAVMFFASVAAKQSPEFVETWLRGLPAKDAATPARMVGTSLAQQGLGPVHDFVVRQDAGLQQAIINGAVFEWASNGKSDLVFEYVKRYPGPDEASEDQLLSVLGEATFMRNPDMAFQLVTGIRNPALKDHSLETAAGFLTGSAPDKAFKFALSMADEDRREKRLTSILTATGQRRPDQARSLIDGSGLPEVVKARYRQLLEAQP